MSSARDRIFGAIRESLGAAPQDTAAIAAEAAALLADPDAIRPDLAGPSLTESFAAKAWGLGTTLDTVAEMEDVPEAVSRYLAQAGLGKGIALQQVPVLTGLDWSGLAPHDTLAPDEPVALGLARYGIAESSSLVIHSAPDNPILLGFLPLHHILVLERRRLLAHLEDYAALVGGEDGIPRNAILITGPSGTTDIEGSYVRGAHGPGFLHVILVGEEG